MVQYRTDLFTSATIGRMLKHFEALLHSIVEDPRQKVGYLPMLSVGEQQELLGYNDSTVEYPKTSTIVSLFEAQVQKTPQATALVCGAESLTYEALNLRANRLAHYLRSRGVKEDSLVPVCIERSTALVVGILGILKAGAGYVPVDTEFPSGRISYMLKDSGSSIAVSSKESRVKIENADASISIIEVEGSALGDQPQSNPHTSLQPHHLAYVIYTSGSTGTPKGVMVEHRHLADYVFGLNQKTQVEQCTTYALVSSIATDLGNTVIYSSLVFGGALHLFSKEAVSNSGYLQQYFKTEGIDCLKIVPSHFRALSAEDELLLPRKLLIFGGEALPSEVVEDIRSTGAGCKIINHYGPTETTIGKLLHVTDAGRQYNSTIPIGKPFSNTQVYVLSRELQLMPAGLPGQLYIAGAGVARGYLNNEALSGEKFIANPFYTTNGQPAGQMYATGDLVKYLGDGSIEFMGRVDDQVKIRGYRIEPSEVENTLQQSALVRQAAVLVKEDRQGTKRLIAYIVAEGGYDREGISAYLKEKLPDYMIPSVMMELESLPLTANGKTDRKALPDPETAEVQGGHYTAPRNEAESRLAQLWQNVLEVEQVGIHDDFFELGGHSLLAVRLISAIRKELSVEMPISDIFDYPTVAGLAGQLEVQSQAAVLPIIQATQVRPPYIPLSFSQERLWFIDKLEGSVQYHVPAVLNLKGSLDTEALSHALKTIVTRHEVLRTVIKQNEGEPYQQINSANNWQLTLIDATGNEGNGEGLQQNIEQLIRKPFDLSEDYMIRAHLFMLGRHDHILVVTLHHIASDGWSRSVLVKELVELYQSHQNKQPANLPVLPVQYADYALWQRHYLQGEVLHQKMAYWKEKLYDVAPLQLPTDFVRPANLGTEGAVKTFVIENSLVKNLNELSQQHESDFVHDVAIGI